MNETDLPQAALSDSEIEHLLAAVSGGDKAALHTLYTACAPRLMGIALRMVRGRRDLAEEVLQDAFLAIWTSAHRFERASGTARSWMAGIVRHKAVDRLRASPWIGREVVNDMSATAKCDGADDALAVRRCLNALEPTQARAIRLSYFYGLTHAELSKAMDAPLGTVKSWVRRGLAALKRCLEQ